MNYFKRVAALLLTLPLLALSFSAGAFEFASNDVYASAFYSMTINHYRADGTYVESMVLSSTYGTQVHSLAFGPDGLLYAVTATSGGFAVVAVDSSGTAHGVYNSAIHIEGSPDDGKITFGANGVFYVTAQKWLTAFQIGSPTGSVIYTSNLSSSNLLSAAAVLPTGNLLVLSAFSLDEITSSGTVVRNILSSQYLNWAGGLAYDKDNDTIFVSNWGSFTGYDASILAIRGSTGHIINGGALPYAKGLLVTSNKQLFIGSWGWAPEVIDENFTTLFATLNHSQTDFTQMSPRPCGQLYGAKCPRN